MSKIRPETLRRVEQVKAWIASGEVTNWTQAGERLGMTRQAAHQLGARFQVEMPGARGPQLSRQEWDVVAEEVRAAIAAGEEITWQAVAEALGLGIHAVRRQLRGSRGLRLPGDRVW